MKNIIEKIEILPHILQPFHQYFGKLRLGVFDIETTGLSPKNSHLILSGFLLLDSGEAFLHQYFAETLEEEKDVLQATLKILLSLDVILTYNGKQFDIPFVDIRRQQMFAAEENPSPYPYNLDLYLLIKTYSPLKQYLPNLRQKTLESFMGLWENREDTISGGESASIYFDYLTSQDLSLEQKMLLHNRDDVLQLYRLLKVLEKTEMHRAMYQQGFPVHTQHHSFQVTDISFGAHRLVITGKQHRAPIAHTCFDGFVEPCGSGGTCSWDFSQLRQTFSIELSTIFEKGMVITDLHALGLNENEFNHLPNCDSGYLILKKFEQINFAETNLLVAKLLERITETWIFQSLQKK